ncbi:viral IAP-associated factor homolog [Tigriopus californicus]|nr:viral IAP-associated factor homolog [Tigriopus californicus]|eukprot:TCALIF_10201-PA protein Name:"Similar to viaf Viral IAP-associated factor homolog (Drosophila melanogaster)" AED:0.04 eAED:0.04 QI:0/0/0/1/1/1/2/0/241
MQNPNEDTEWNDILRQKGIIPDKPKEPEITEEDIVAMVEQTIDKKANGKTMDEMNLDELDELEDEEEEKVLEQYRLQRMAEIRALQAKSNYGDVREISANDYVQEVNQAGKGVWVVLHLYKQGVPLCALLNQYLSQISAKFPTVKFLKSISTTCIPNYPDKNLPTIFVYFEGELKTQIVGPMSFRGMNLTVEEFEFMLGRTGAVDTTITEDPKPKVKDVMFSSLKDGRNTQGDESSDENDW